jgi:DNA-binding PadR family transcriptional regulator
MIMTSMKTERRSPIALAVLALLYEEAMHPYRMQQLIKQRGKDTVINVRQRASLYQTIQRLERAKLIQVRETAREEKWPERTIYELTEQGRATLDQWIREMLAKRAREFPEFPAALSFLPLLPPEEALHQLQARESALAAELNQADTQLGSHTPVVPRLFLIEAEYVRALLHTELEWVRSLIADLQSGQLTWSEEWLRAVAAQLERDEKQE